MVFTSGHHKLKTPNEQIQVLPSTIMLREERQIQILHLSFKITSYEMQLINYYLYKYKQIHACIHMYIFILDL